MLYGIRPEEQKRLAAAGETVRVYIPYGTEWYGYLMRRLAEKPQNLGFFVRSLVSKSRPQRPRRDGASVQIEQAPRSRDEPRAS